VRFFHTDGRCLIYAKHAVITPDWNLVFLHGMLAWKQVAVDGGSVEISMDPDGRLSLEAMMNAPREPGEPLNPYGGLHYDLRGMNVQNLDVRVHLSKQLEYRVRDVSGFVRVSRIDTPGVQVVLDHIRGPIEPDIAGAKVAIEDLTGWVHGEATEVVR